MKYVSLFALLALAFVATGCSRVEPGFVGIEVNNYGNQKGVQDFPIKTGRVWYNPFTTDLYTFPTFMQNKVWAKTDEGDESLTFNSIEGANISVDIALSYSIEGEKVPAIFIKHRKDADTITGTYLRTQVRTAFNDIGGTYKAVEIFGEKKQQFVAAVTKRLKDTLKREGFIIDTVGIVGSPRADNRVMASINATIEASQKAIEAENKVKQIEAEARQEVAKAEGKSEGILLEAKAQAEANKLLTESITPELVRYRALEKWNGVAPKVMGGDSGLLLSIPVDEK